MDGILTDQPIEILRSVYGAILGRYAIGESLNGQDFYDVLDLLKKHPNKDQKIGVGITNLLVDNDGYGGKCFHLVRQDDTKEKFSYLKCLGYKKQEHKPQSTKQAESKPKSKQAESKPVKNTNTAKATAKSAKITLMLDPASITRVDSTGQKQTKLKITVDGMKFEADLNSKSYRKALAAIDEFGVGNCAAMLQGSMKIFPKIESAGLAVQLKKTKED